MTIKTEETIVSWANTIVKGPFTELGLIFGDTVRKWRFNNQLRILESAKKKCEKYKIDIKHISPKLLCPLLDFSSLEDDPEMQDKWANLLTNMLDSEQNIQNHILPELLSKISKNEFQVIDKFIREAIVEWDKLVVEYQNLEQETHDLIREQTNAAPEIIAEHGENSHALFEFNDYYRNKHYEINYRMDAIQQAELIVFRLNEEIQLSPIEISNLTRLGILFSIPRTFATGRTPSRRLNRNVEVSIIHDGFDYEITELGFELFRVCDEIVKPN